MLSAGCAHVGPSRAHVEPSWARLGLMLGRAHVEPSGPSWAYIGPGWAYVGLILGPCWVYAMLAYVGPTWPHVEPSWELCWGHVWAIYVDTILRCQFFLPGRLIEPKTTTDVFEHRQDKIRGHRRARNSVKNEVF